jgi:2-polyprenyl-3-methyl-5-hydroxy-6-metoxy-1,4-benzoquinol methylase
MMPVINDPEGVNVTILHKMSQFDGKRVFEIGCGDGRITWGYADAASHVTAIDPISEDIQTANLETPEHLKECIDFIEVGIEEFEPPGSPQTFDIALFAWSL